MLVQPLTASRSPEWVSKTDLTRYLRCPYSFWLLDSGQITFDDTVDDFQRQLLQNGVLFQELVETPAIRIEIQQDDLPGLLRQELTLLNVPFENKKLHLLGIPDGVETGSGALYPIEIKSHKDVQRTDELELAFYWLLLHPYRTKQIRNPKGYLILRRNGLPKRIEVPILPHRLEEARKFIEDVRAARRSGVRRRICGCTVCSQLRREEVHEAAHNQRDLTLIWGIGLKYAPALESLGLQTWEELLEVESVEVVEKMRDAGFYISKSQVDTWKRHARSFKKQEPIYFGPAPCPPSEYIALDLEYIAHPERLIWLIGTAVVEGDSREYSLIWADDQATEAANLFQLAEIIAAHPSLPVVTWAGVEADIPNLRLGVQRHSLGSTLDSLFERHLDLFLQAKRNLRLPIPELGLKEIAQYFGITRVSKVRDGREAESAFFHYRRSTNEAERNQLKDELREYTRDDLESLVEITSRINSMAALASIS